VIDRIVQMILAWARTETNVRAIALVGSHARGTARADSDVDLVVLTNVPEFFRADTSWLDAIGWRGADSRLLKWQDEEHGVLWSRRLWLEQGRLEVEIGFARPAWAEVNPLDPGTQRVVADGCRILHDPDRLLARLCAAVGGRPQ